MEAEIMHGAEERKEENLLKLVADALLKTGKLSSLREKLLHVESSDEYNELLSLYGSELRETIKVLEEATRLDSKGEHRYLHMVICSIIFDSMFHPDKELFPLQLIRDEDVWKALDLHCMETLQSIEEFFKRIMGLRADMSERPDSWKELKIYTDRDKLNTFFLFDVCKRIRSDDPDIWHLMSKIYENLARYARRKGLPRFERYLNSAEEYLTKTVELDPRRGSAWSSLAQIHFEKKEYDKALECYMKRLELAEYKAWSVWEKMAEVHEAKGDVGKALDCVKSVVELNPTPTHYLRLAGLLAKVKRRAEALQAIGEADKNRLERGRKYNEWELRQLYHVYSELSDYEKCIEVLGRLVTLAKEDLLRGAKAEWVKQRLEGYRQLASEMLVKIVKEPLPKQQKKELLTATLEKAMEYLD